MSTMLNQAKKLFKSVGNTTEKIKQKSKQRHDELQKELEILIM